VHEGAAGLLVYAAIVAAAHLRRHLREQEARRLAQSSLEARLARERLRNLQMQLHPHFLFNTLHAVGGIIREGDRKTAVETVSDLGDLLRRSLELGDRQLVRLDEELDFIGAYLKIQQARYGSRLRVTVTVGEGTRGALVPHLVLQPLVENAIRHGTSRVESGGTISVTAAIEGARLVLAVADDGPGPGEGENTEGIGLRNTRERLVELYASDFSMRLERHDDEGTRVTLKIPYRTTEGTAPV
jgi:LytS/YehU family sensor histidine kinase